MPKVMKTGIDGLDKILDGGFLYHNSILLKGPPGSGKTTLGIQIIYNGVVKFNEPGMIVLFEQFPQQLFRDLSSYNWDIENLVKEKKLHIKFAMADEVTSKDKILDSPLMSEINYAAGEIGAKRILVDSVSNFINIVKDQYNEREQLLRFINALKSLGLTPIMTAERENEEGRIGFDEYLTDCVLLLSSEARKDKTFQIRQIEVRKTRGHNHIRGKHPISIAEKGIEVFPHYTTKGFGKEEIKDFKLEKVPSGINGLDELLGGGYTRGTSNIIAGMPGTFKSTVGVQFISEGAKSGEAGLIVTFNENPQFIIKVMQEKGLNIEPYLPNGMIKILQFFPKEFYMEELLYLLEQEITQNKIKRVVVDGINDLERSIEDPDSYKDYISSILSLFFSNNITSLFIQKLEQFTGNVPLANIRYASLFDGIIYIGNIEIESAMHKAVSVLKMRGGDYSGDLREIVCGKNGLFVLDKFVGLTGILGGNPQGQYKKTVEEIFQPLYFVRDFIEILTSSELDKEQREQVTSSLKSEVNKLVEKLKKHFDVKK